MMELANNPNSHAACVAFIVWGMYFLIKWWQLGGWWRGSIAGFLIGYACTIRYSEGLLVLPIAVACASRLRWTDWKSYLRCAVPGLMWAVPIGAMLIFNKRTMGNWTGYDSTNIAPAWPPVVTNAFRPLTNSEPSRRSTRISGA